VTRSWPDEKDESVALSEEATMKTEEKTLEPIVTNNASTEENNEALPLVVKTLRVTMRTSLSAGTYARTVTAKARQAD
jgi:hypothetical protein